MLTVRRHPFDTIKIRMQTALAMRFKSPFDCLLQTMRKEGFRALYKGATPQLIGCMSMDSLMLGSLAQYRRLINAHVVQPFRARQPDIMWAGRETEKNTLPLLGHGIAGMLAGWTVSLLAAPIEHVKARLQVHYSAQQARPTHLACNIIRLYGIYGLWHGLGATLLFRTFFFFWWSSYELLTRTLHKHTNLSVPAVNFWAGGLSAQIFWITSYPFDVVKHWIMTDDLGAERKFLRWRDAAKAVHQSVGWRGYWRGFVPCFLRAFPANGMALVVFEGVMRVPDRSKA